MPRFTEDSWRNDPKFRALCTALLACKSIEEMADFLRDIGTLAELAAWSERLEVAKQLARGLSYRQVAANIGASTTTVTRVAKFIENGEGGYRRFLKSSKSTQQIPLSPTQQLQQRLEQHHGHASSPAHSTELGASGEKSASVLRKYIGTKE